ncbi:MAG: hypothetical protein KKB31_05825 [Nanoarchaeota archaeon]|nr:hypothetical protein [Nanoarchaeota archaeon]
MQLVPNKFFTIDDPIKYDVCPFCGSGKRSDYEDFEDSGEPICKKRSFYCGYSITRYASYLTHEDGPELCSNSKEHNRIHTIKFFAELYKTINNTLYGNNEMRVAIKDLLKKAETSYL